eukprot:7283914-Prymnesium_polylepis.1
MPLPGWVVGTSWAISFGGKLAVSTPPPLRRSAQVGGAKGGRAAKQQQTKKKLEVDSAASA